MTSMNKAFLMGFLTRDPETTATQNSSVTKFGLAINRKYKQGDDWKEETCFVDITVWGKQGENCQKYLNRGSGVMVEGRLNFQTWETEEGQKRSKLDVVAINVQFLPRGNQSQGESQSKSGDQNNNPSNVDNEDETRDIPF